MNRHNMRCYLVILAVLFLVNCNSESMQATAGEWPISISGLDGWMGMELEKGIRCPVCYSLVIPKAFGLNNKEKLLALVDITRVRTELHYDLDGPLFVDRDVLDHLLNLAIEYQYGSAGKIIVNPGKYGMVIGLETSEDIEETHLFPLLRNYQDINSLIANEDFEVVTRRLCGWSVDNLDFRMVDDLIKNLTERKYLLLAKSLSSACEVKKTFLKEQGVKFGE